MDVKSSFSLLRFSIILAFSVTKADILFIFHVIHHNMLCTSPLQCDGLMCASWFQSTYRSCFDFRWKMNFALFTELLFCHIAILLSKPKRQKEKTAKLSTYLMNQILFDFVLADCYQKIGNRPRVCVCVCVCVWIHLWLTIILVLCSFDWMISFHDSVIDYFSEESFSLHLPNVIWMNEKLDLKYK